MDRLRVGIALALVLGYIGLVVYAALRPQYHYPPGTVVVVGAAIGYLLGAPTAERIGRLRFDVHAGGEKDDDGAP
jgi:uncharacterized membrane protein YfcA